MKAILDNTSNSKISTPYNYSSMNSTPAKD